MFVTLMGSHTIRMVFALITPYSTFFKDDLMVVNWLKYLSMKNKNTLLCFTETTNY